MHAGATSSVSIRCQNLACSCHGCCLMHCNRLVVVAKMTHAFSDCTVSIFCVFFEKKTPYGKIFKILFRKFAWRHRLTLLCSNVVTFLRQKIGEIMRYLPDTDRKQISAPLQTVTTARIAPKICEGQPPTCGSQSSIFDSNRFTFGGVIAERVKAVLLAHRVYP